MTRPSSPAPPNASKPSEGRALVVRTSETFDGGRDQGARARDESAAARKARAKAEAAFSAQMMGQEGAKRGLKGGAPVLEQARSAYLEAEWRGPHDRRMPAGILRKTEV